MSEVSIAQLEAAVTSLRKLLKARKLELPASSLLAHRLDEVERFTSEARDLPTPPSASEQDQLAVRIGGELLDTFMLCDAIADLVRAKVKHLIQTLRSLAVFTVGNDEHAAQYTEAAFELTSAASFLYAGARPSFINTKRRSRYKQRVEFLLQHKWPVECKKPRSSARLMERAQDGAAKINERKRPGIVALNVNSLVAPAHGDFFEVECIAQLQKELSGKVHSWLTENEDALRKQVLSEHVRAVVFDFTVVAYLHDSEAIATPTMRGGFTLDGVVTTAVVDTVVAKLKGEG